MLASTYYRWQRRIRSEGEAGLKNTGANHLWPLRLSSLLQDGCRRSAAAADTPVPK